MFFTAQSCDETIDDHEVGHVHNESDDGKAEVIDVALSNALAEKYAVMVHLVNANVAEFAVLPFSIEIDITFAAKFESF